MDGRFQSLDHPAGSDLKVVPNDLRPRTIVYRPDPGKRDVVRVYWRGEVDPPFGPTTFVDDPDKLGEELFKCDGRLFECPVDLL